MIAKEPGVSIINQDVCIIDRQLKEAILIKPHQPFYFTCQGPKPGNSTFQWRFNQAPSLLHKPKVNTNKNTSEKSISKIELIIKNSGAHFSLGFKDKTRNIKTSTLGIFGPLNHNPKGFSINQLGHSLLTRRYLLACTINQQRNEKRPSFSCKPHQPNSNHQKDQSIPSFVNIHQQNQRHCKGMSLTPRDLIRFKHCSFTAEKFTETYRPFAF